MASRAIEEVLLALIEAVEAIKRRLDDPRQQTREDLAALIAEAISNIEIPPGEPGKPGAPGRAPTATEIQAAVDIWLEVNRELVRGPRGLRGIPGEPGTNGRNGLPGAPGRDGRHGRDATDEQVYEAVVRWLAQHREVVRGEKGEKGTPGEQGVGIDKIEQRGSKGSFWVVLTNGEEYEVKLPQSSGGMPYGGATQRQQVYIGEQPSIQYPAISFTAVDGYPDLYIESVNVT